MRSKCTPSGNGIRLWWLLILAAVLLARLDDVGVQRALREELHALERGGLLEEDLPELLADDAALVLRVGDAGEQRRGSGPRRRTCTRSTWNWSRKTCTTSSASSRRSMPWSTKTHVSWSPIARCSSAATTSESTPPDRPQMTFASPTCARIALDGLVDDVDHRPRRRDAGDVVQEALDACPGRTAVCATSGWNCVAYSLRAASSIAATPVVGGARGDARSPSGARADAVAVAHPHLLRLAAAPSKQRARRRRSRSARRSRTRRCRSCGISPPRSQRHQLDAVAEARGSGCRARRSRGSMCGAPSA